MMKTRRRLREEIITLSYRVADLEERLCPCEDHDWKVISRRTKFHDYGICSSIEHLKCKRCGKVTEREGW